MYYMKELPLAKGTKSEIGLLLQSKSKKYDQKRISKIRDSKMSNMERFAKIFGQFCFIFMEESNIHGFNHLTAKKRSSLEHFFWIILISCFLACAVKLGLSTWERYQESPTVISMERDYKEWNTSVPSCSVCPYTVLDDNKVKQFVRSFKDNYTDSNKLSNFIHILSGVSYDSFHLLDNYTDITIAPEDYLNIIMQNLRESSATAQNTLEEQETFSLKMIMTERGVCYTYNSNIAIYSSPQYWLNRQWNFMKGDKIIFGNPDMGPVGALIRDLDMSTKVYFHGVNEIPDSVTKGFDLPVNNCLDIKLSAFSIYTTPQVYSLSIKQRKCRYPEESNLEISLVYSYNLCRMQCRMYLANATCGCVPHFYRRIDKLKICDVNGLLCLSQHKDLLIKLIYPDSGKKVECNCLPPCNDFIYKVDAESVWLMTFGSHTGTMTRWDLIRYPRTRFKRDVLFGFTELVVGIGGTVGLFLGCSLLSFIEIIYFFSLRIFWYLYGQHRKKLRNLSYYII